MKAQLDVHDKNYLQTAFDLSDDQAEKLVEYLKGVEISVDCTVLSEAEDWVETLMEKEEDDEEDDDPLD